VYWEISHQLKPETHSITMQQLTPMRISETKYEALRTDHGGVTESKFMQQKKTQ